MGQGASAQASERLLVLPRQRNADTCPIPAAAAAANAPGRGWCVSTAWLGADVSDNSTTLTQAFLEADEVLHAGVRGISDIITVRGWGGRWGAHTAATQTAAAAGGSCCGGAR